MAGAAEVLVGVAVSDGISEEGRDFLGEHGLLRAEETLQTIYDQVEKTKSIERYDSATRPER